MAALSEILQQHPVWRGSGSVSVGGSTTACIATGFPALDAELPGGGWPTGALTELSGLQEGIGELQILLPTLARLSSAGKRIIWLAPPHLPYAPALAAAGIDLAHLA